MSVEAIILKQMPQFKRAYKKLHSRHPQIVNQKIRDIIQNPLLGELKKGDLTGVYVYTFKIDGQEMLLAYEWDPTQRVLLALGVHENFYRNLKNR
jgi:mRNA interferase RelE/StbE